MSTLISLCRIKIEIDNYNIKMHNDENIGAGAIPSESSMNPRMLREHRGQRKSRKIKIENYTNLKLDSSSSTTTNKKLSESSSASTIAGAAGADIAKGILPFSSRETTPLDEKSPSEYLLEDKHFYSGNPFVEITNGIIHLYKRNERIDIKNELSKTLCLLSVPATINCHDLFHFIAPCHPVLQHIRIIRDGTPNQFMVLLEFRSGESAMEFYQTYNGTPYNSMEPDSLCHALWVSGVEWGNNGIPPLGHTELPMCPVCLERMDESVDGVLTILCNHTFHANCLIKWGDSTCPVCRCVQTPELSESSVCMECEGNEALWICLICGHVGCGRYQGGHAATHYRMTKHTYALQLGTNRVWDYAGDNFVHRLLQSKTDGKLVATDTPGGAATAEDDEKVDSMQLEFTYLLTSQLDTQRKYYKDKLIRLEKLIENEKQNFNTKIDGISQKCTGVESKLQQVCKEKTYLDKKLQTLQTKLNTVTKELAEERQMTKALQSNQSTWQTKYNLLEIKHKEYIAAKENEIQELNEQIRDLMFYMEAQNTIANSDIKDELVTASVVIPEQPPQQSSSVGQNGGKLRRKKK